MMGKRILSLLLALALIVSLLAACGSSKSGENGTTSATEQPKPTETTKAEDKPKEEAKPQKMVYWDKSEYVPAYNKKMKEYAAAWGTKSNVQVEYVVVPAADWSTKLTAAVEAANPPDLFMYDEGFVKQFETLGQLESLLDIFKKHKFREFAYNYFLVNNDITVIPLYYGSPASFYVRKDIFEKNGISYTGQWKDLYEQATKMNDPKGGFYAFGLPLGPSGGGDSEGLITGMISNTGVDLVDLKTGKLQFGDPRVKEAFDLIVKIYKEKLSPPDSLVWDDTGNNTAYLGGQVAMINNSTSVWAKMVTENPDLLAKSMLVRFPTNMADGSFRPIRPVGAGGCYAVPKGAKNKEAAKKFIDDFLTDKQTYHEFVKAMSGLWVDSITDFDEDEFWKRPENADALKLIKSVDPTLQPHEQEKMYWSIATQQKLFTKAMQEVVAGKKTSAAALKDVEKEWKKIFKEE
jgi:multiple sugar transport system substrate-binding protein